MMSPSGLCNNKTEYVLETIKKQSDFLKQSIKNQEQRKEVLFFVFLRQRKKKIVFMKKNAKRRSRTIILIQTYMNCLN